MSMYGQLANEIRGYLPELASKNTQLVHAIMGLPGDSPAKSELFKLSNDLENPLYRAAEVVSTLVDGQSIEQYWGITFGRRQMFSDWVDAVVEGGNVDQDFIIYMTDLLRETKTWLTKVSVELSSYAAKI